MITEESRDLLVDALATAFDGGSPVTTFHTMDGRLVDWGLPEEIDPQAHAQYLGAEVYGVKVFPVTVDNSEGA